MKQDVIERDAPLVSVIVLTYNQAQTIGRTLDSVLRQDVNFGMEIVVSDDCSTDTTRAVVEKYHSRYPDIIRLLPKSQHRGVVDNYFYALSQCGGGLIADCAGDDYWLDPDGLQRRVNTMLSDRSLAFVCADWMTFDPGAPEILSDAIGCRYIPVDETLSGERYIEPMLSLLHGLPIHLSTVVYRRSVLDQAMALRKDIVYNPDFGSEDMPIILALLDAGNFRWMGGIPVLAYGVGADTVSSPADSLRASDYFMQAAGMIAALGDYYGVSRRCLSPVLSDKLNYALACALSAGDRRLQRKVLSEAARLHIKPSIKNCLRLLFNV